jgi:hypothetical protein
VALLGDIHGGRFRVLETRPQEAAPPGGPRTFRIDLDLDRATLVALICEEVEVSRWRDHLGRLASEPWKLPGR